MGSTAAVASVVYNMAGDEANRPQYLKSLVVRKVFSRTKESMGEAITNGLLHGPGMRLRSFYNWAATAGNYDQVGLPVGTLSYNPDFDDLSDAVMEEIEDDLPSDRSVTGLSTLIVGPPSPIYWAERWLYDNRPGDVDEEWFATINEALSSIFIEFTSDSDSTISVTSPTYDPAARYVYAVASIFDSGESVSFSMGWLYKVGSGNATIDALVPDEVPGGTFFPPIPVRLNNQFLSESYQPLVYAEAKKAYGKALGGAKFTKLIEEIEDNESLEDIDHAHIVFGVSLNVLENTSREYLYRFFDDLRDVQIGGVSAYSAWVADGSIPNRARWNSISIRNSVGLHMEIWWKFITETSGSGLGKVGAKVGELWFDKNGSISGVGNRLRLYWQRTATSYTYLEIVAGQHYNFYGAHYVLIDSFDAIDDADESGFIVPLRYDLWYSMGMIKTTQMATACVFIVFNCLEIVKTKWYEEGIFKVLLVIVIAVASALLTGGGGGILGANLALGMALGFSGTTALILGAVANALAAMILVSFLEPVLQQLGFIGPIIGAILMFAIGQAVSSFQSLGTITINWSDLLKVDNLLAMTNAVGQGITNQINMDTLALQQETLDYLEKAEAEALKIQQAFFAEFGYGAAIIDPLMLVDAGNGPIAESSDTFLARTLMTGSEIAEMSRELLYEFPTYSLKLPDAFT